MSPYRLSAKIANYSVPSSPKSFQLPVHEIKQAGKVILFVVFAPAICAVILCLGVVAVIWVILASMWRDPLPEVIDWAHSEEFMQRRQMIEAQRERMLKTTIHR
jgi:hypothetical protein